MVLTSEERITRAKIQLYEKQPFFSYIVNHLKIIPFSKEEEEQMLKDKGYCTMGVDAKGNCYYSNKFVEQLSESVLTTILCHEAMHCALLHLIRIGSKDAKIWNIATDLAINSLLQSNNFQFPDGNLKPILAENNTYKIGDKSIYDVDKKTAEMLYNELYNFADKIEQPTFDVHIYSGNGDGENKEGKSNIKQGDMLSKDDIDKWKQVISDATYFAKSKGNLAGNIERMVEKILNKKLNWKQLLYRYITNEVQHDFTYARPSRKFISTGIYFPSTARENIKIMAAIDTSGSISHKELGLFLGEIYKITKSFPNMELEVLFHDTEISSRNKFTRTNLHKIVDLQPTGGGGTSHTDVFEYVYKNKPNILICFTDGYSDIDSCKPFNNTIFVLTEQKMKFSFGKEIYFDRSDI
jgi:predicted metal-dependent peptidase